MTQWDLEPVTWCTEKTKLHAVGLVREVSNFRLVWGRLLTRQITGRSSLHVSTPWKTGTTEEAQVAGRIKREKLQCSMGSCIGLWNADRISTLLKVLMLIFWFG
jgi:hypothetical protein